MKMRSHARTTLKTFSLINGFLMQQCYATTSRAARLKHLSLVLASVVIRDDEGNVVWSAGNNPISVFAYDTFSSNAIAYHYANRNTTEPLEYTLVSPFFNTSTFYVLPSRDDADVLDTRAGAMWSKEQNDSLVQYIFEKDEDMIQRFWKYVSMKTKIGDSVFDAAELNREPVPVIEQLIPELCDLKRYLDDGHVEDKEACIERLERIFGNITVNVHHGHNVVNPLGGRVSVDTLDAHCAKAISDNVFEHYQWIADADVFVAPKLRCSLIVGHYGVVVFDVSFPTLRHNSFAYNTARPLVYGKKREIIEHVLGSKEAVDNYVQYIRSICV